MHARFTKKITRFITIRKNHRNVVKYDICMKLLVEEDTFRMVLGIKKYLACQLAYKKQSPRNEGCTSISKEPIKHNVNSYLVT